MHSATLGRLAMTENQRLKITRTIDCILSTIPESAPVILEAVSQHIQTCWGPQIDVHRVANALLLTADNVRQLEDMDI